MPLSSINLAVLVSGSGTTLQNLIDRIASRQLDARIKLVIGSRPGLLGIDRATKANLPNETVDRKSFTNVAQFSKHIFDLVERANVDLVCLAAGCAFSKSLIAITTE